MDCVSIQPSFFANKRVEFDDLRKVWKIMESKNPRPRTIPERQGQEGGSSSHPGNVEEMQKAVQTAVEPLLAQIAQLHIRMEESEARDKARYEESEARHEARYDRITDELDVLRQAAFIGMRNNDYNEILNYRTDLERARAERHGDRARGSRREHPRSQQDDDNASSSRTGSGGRTRNPSQD